MIRTDRRSSRVLTRRRRSVSRLKPEFRRMRSVARSDLFGTCVRPGCHSLLEQTHGKIRYGAVAAVEVALLPVLALPSRLELGERKQFRRAVVALAREPYLVALQHVLPVQAAEECGVMSREHELGTALVDGGRPEQAHQVCGQEWMQARVYLVGQHQAASIENRSCPCGEFEKPQCSC